MSLTDCFRYQMILTADYSLHYVVIMYKNTIKTIKNNDNNNTHLFFFNNNNKIPIQHYLAHYLVVVGVIHSLLSGQR